MDFQWDAKKAISNLGKHGVTFQEAETVFRDPLAILFPDPDHSIGEKREIIVGYSDSGQLLVVSFTERAVDSIRIISARRADNAERRKHEQERD